MGEGSNASDNDKKNTKGKDAQDSNDIANPYFIHHLDHPGMVLVSKPLVGENYGTWHLSMSIALSEKNKIGFIDGTIQKSSSVTQPNEYQQWKRCNDMILSWILNSLKPDLANSVIYAETTHEVWTDLNERFSQSNAPRIFQIKRDIALHTQEQLSLSTYYTKLKGLWDELASYNTIEEACICSAKKFLSEKEERKKLMQFLMGLNESYAATRGQILLINPLPTVKKAYSLVLQEEKQRELSTTRGTTENMAMLTINNSGEASLRPHNKFSQGTNQKGCSYCKYENHTIDRCYFLNGFSPGHRWHNDNLSSDSKPKLDRAGLRQLQQSSTASKPQFSKGGSKPHYQSWKHQQPSSRAKPTAHNVQGHPGSSIEQIQSVAPSLTFDQCKKIMETIQNGDTSQDQTQANFAGVGFEEDDWIG